jgi:hypothetical protein
MNTNKTMAGLALSVLLSALAAQNSFAQPSNLSVTNIVLPSSLTNLVFDFTTLTNPLQAVDIEIHKVSDGQTNLELEVTYSAPSSQDGRGKITGTGTTTAEIDPQDSGPVDFDGPYTSKGSVTGSKGVTHLTFSTKVSGTASLEGKDRSVSASMSLSAKFDSVNDVLSYTQVSHASASGLGSLSESRKRSMPLSSSDVPEELGDGGWTLVLNLGAANGNKLSGTASVTLDSGAVYNYNFTGTFSPHTQVSKLNLKGVDSAKGSTLQVVLDGSNAVTRITGRVAGQTVKLNQ